MYILYLVNGILAGYEVDKENKSATRRSRTSVLILTHKKDATTPQALQTTCSTCDSSQATTNRGKYSRYLVDFTGAPTENY